MPNSLQQTIEDAFDARDSLGPHTTGAVREAVEEALVLLDRGEARVAERAGDGAWTVNEWLKKAVLLSFRLNDMVPIEGGPGGGHWWDKVPSKFKGWGERAFREAGFRAVPGSIVPPFRLRGPGRHPHAVLRQSRRLRRPRHHGRYLGHRRLLRPGRPQLPPVGRRPGSAGCSSRCRPTPSSSRMIVSLAPARRSSKG